MAEFRVFSGHEQLFFSIQHRRSLHTLRIHYGIEGMKYIVQIYEGESTVTEKERACRPSINMNLNRRC